MTLDELKARVISRISTDNAVIQTAAEDGINSAIDTLCMLQDFDELTSLSTSSTTSPNKKIYDLETDFGLVRPKDILSIRLIDGSSSKKLTFVPPQELDQKIPYTEIYLTGRPSFYTRRGKQIELFRIPDKEYPLHIFYIQWHPKLVDGTDTLLVQKIAPIVIELATAHVYSVISGSPAFDIVRMAQTMIGTTRKDITTRPDDFYVARKFDSQKVYKPAEYWIDPFVRR